MTVPGSRCSSRQPHANPEDAAEVTQRLLLGGDTVECGQRGYQVARGSDGSVRSMNGLVHPVLQRGVKLLGLRGEHQYVAFRQPHLGCTGDGRHRCPEGAIRRPQHDAVGGQHFGVPAARDQYRWHTCTGQHSAEGAAYRPGTDNHVPMVVSRRHATGPSVVGSTTRLWCALL